MATPQGPHAFLDSLAPSTIRFGLERMSAADDRLGNPWRAYRCLHVAGTNGKGSTCAFAEAILRAAGQRVGLYTSPHLQRVNERIRIDGHDLTDDQLSEGIDAVCRAYPQVQDPSEGLTYFEFLTALAFERFRAMKVDVAVIEVGLGGRLDATNVITPAACAISTIALDHTEYLGETLSKIAVEKAGILKRGVPFALQRVDPEAERAIVEVAERVGARRVQPEPWVVDGEVLRLGERSVSGITLGLSGPHQRDNAALGALASQLVLETSDEAIRQGLAHPRWPGRMETAGDLLLDGAHNAEGARALARALGELGGPWHAVFGVLRDKDVAEMLTGLAPALSSLHLVRPDNPRALDPQAVASAVSGLRLPITTYDSLAHGLAAARQLARSSRGRVVVCGSLYLVGQVRSLVLGDAPADELRSNGPR